MIIRSRHSGAVELRSGVEWGSSAIPLPDFGFRSYAGKQVTANDAMGLPALSSAIRLVSESIGMLPIVVKNDGVRDEGAWQHALLNERPNAEQSPTDFVTQIAASIEINGNAYLHKIKDRTGRVVELLIMDPERMKVERNPDTGLREFEVFSEDGAKRLAKLTSDEIIFIPGFSPPGYKVGLSPIQMHRHSIGNSMAMMEFSGRYFANDASPGLVITVPGQMGKQQAQNMLEIWKSTHGGVANSHLPAILANGASLEKIPINMQDAAYVEQSRMGVEDIARIFRIPAHMLAIGNPSGGTAEQESIRFLNYTLMPRLRRIEQGLARDLDLFGGTDLKPHFVVESLLRADLPTRYTSYVAARQAGWLSANEIRELEGRQPVEGGDEVQMTPVGGAPNPNTGQTQ